MRALVVLIATQIASIIVYLIADALSGVPDIRVNQANRPILSCESQADDVLEIAGVEFITYRLTPITNFPCDKTSVLI